jgi:hypothetical protein
MTRIKQNKITLANELTPVPTTPMQRLGPTSKDNIVEEIIRVVIVRCVGNPIPRVHMFSNKLSLLVVMCYVFCMNKCTSCVIVIQHFCINP